MESEIPFMSANVLISAACQILRNADALEMPPADQSDDREEAIVLLNKALFVLYHSAFEVFESGGEEVDGEWSPRFSQKIVHDKAHEAWRMVTGKIKMICDAPNLDYDSISKLENLLMSEFGDQINVEQAYLNSQPEPDQ